MHMEYTCTSSNWYDIPELLSHIIISLIAGYCLQRSYYTKSSKGKLKWSLCKFYCGKTCMCQLHLILKDTQIKTLVTHINQLSDQIYFLFSICMILKFGCNLLILNYLLLCSTRVRLCVCANKCKAHLCIKCLPGHYHILQIVGSHLNYSFHYKQDITDHFLKQNILTMIYKNVYWFIHKFELFCIICMFWSSFFFVDAKDKIIC